MMIFRSDSLSRDVDNYDRAQAKALEALPRCSECDEPIQDEYCYQINGELICEECLKEYRRSTEDFI
jgi:formylmethanofuran dehydrogenase subunit E